jgi:hypothetical protein
LLKRNERLKMAIALKGKGNTGSNLETEQAAIVMESLMFRNQLYVSNRDEELVGISTDTYDDESHSQLHRNELWNNQLKAMMVTIMQRKVQKESESHDRLFYLRSVLKSIDNDKENKSLFKRVCQVVENIRRLRMSFALPLPVEQQKTYDGGRKLPMEVRDLFFNTTLLSAIDNLPMEQFSTLDWYAMLRQAETHMQAFHRYRHEQQQRRATNQTPIEIKSCQS